MVSQTPQIKVNFAEIQEPVSDVAILIGNLESGTGDPAALQDQIAAKASDIRIAAVKFEAFMTQVKAAAAAVPPAAEERKAA